MVLLDFPIKLFYSKTEVNEPWKGHEIGRLLWFTLFVEISKIVFIVESLFLSSSTRNSPFPTEL